MTYEATAPAAVDQLKSQIIACASAIAASIGSSSIHYPQAALSTDDATSADARPLVVLAELQHRRQCIGGGAISLPSGTLSATIHADLAAGVLEKLGRDIANELNAQAPGLPALSAEAGLCTDPTPGARAVEDSTVTDNAAFRSITITVTYGLLA